MPKEKKKRSTARKYYSTERRTPLLEHGRFNFTRYERPGLGDASRYLGVSGLASGGAVHWWKKLCKTIQFARNNPDKAAFIEENIKRFWPRDLEFEGVAEKELLAEASKRAAEAYVAAKGGSVLAGTLFAGLVLVVEELLMGQVFSKWIMGEKYGKYTVLSGVKSMISSIADWWKDHEGWVVVEIGVTDQSPKNYQVNEERLKADINNVLSDIEAEESSITSFKQWHPAPVLFMVPRSEEEKKSMAALNALREKDVVGDDFKEIPTNNRFLVNIFFTSSEAVLKLVDFVRVNNLMLEFIQNPADIDAARSTEYAKKVRYSKNPEALKKSLDDAAARVRDEMSEVMMTIDSLQERLDKMRKYVTDAEGQKRPREGDDEQNAEDDSKTDDEDDNIPLDPDLQEMYENGVKVLSQLAERNAANAPESSGEPSQKKQKTD